MRAFITGMTGFAGVYLAEHLFAQGDAVMGCSHSGQWRNGNPAQPAQRAELLRWDIATDPPEEVRSRLEEFQPDCIFHLAAISVPADCGREQPTPQATAVNVEGTGRVLQLAAELSKRPRVLLASSCYVYAPVDSRHPQVDEDSPLGPVSAYGKTKLAAELQMRQAADEGMVDAVIARVFQHTGPGQSPRMILPQWARQFAAGGEGPIEVGSLDTYLDLSDVRDVVAAYRLLAERAASGRVYNIGSGVNCQSGDLFYQLCRLTGQDRQVVENAPGRFQHPVADISRIAAEVGWRPKISLETTLADILAYWKSQASVK